MDQNNKIIQYEVIYHSDLTEEDAKYSARMWKERNINWIPKFEGQKPPEFNNFTSLINDKIKEGWIPQGGIYIKKIGLEDNYFQSMIKYETIKYN